jgi:hypothetical protein
MASPSTKTSGGTPLPPFTGVHAKRNAKVGCGRRPANLFCSRTKEIRQTALASHIRFLRQTALASHIHRGAREANWWRVLLVKTATAIPHKAVHGQKIGNSLKKQVRLPDVQERY